MVPCPLQGGMSESLVTFLHSCSLFQGHGWEHRRWEEPCYLSVSERPGQGYRLPFLSRLNFLNGCLSSRIAKWPFRTEADIEQGAHALPATVYLEQTHSNAAVRPSFPIQWELGLRLGNTLSHALDTWNDDYRSFSWFSASFSKAPIACLPLF